MRRLHMLLALALPAALAAQTIVFDPAVILPESEQLTVVDRPRVVIDDSGTEHLLWCGGNSGHGQVRYARASAEGVFGSSQIISGQSNCLVEGGAGPDLVIRNGYMSVGWEDVNSSNRGIWSVSSQDGISWSDPARADEAVPRTRYLQSTALFLDGRASECWLTRTTELGYYFAWSVQDSTGTYLPPIAATEVSPGQVCECCYPSQVVLDDGQTVLLAFRNNVSNLRDIHMVRSTDGGATFPQDVRVDSTGWVINGCPGTGPHIVSSGVNVYMTFMSAADGTARIYAVRSLNSGETWGENIEIDPAHAGRTRNYPQIAVRDSLVVIVWQGLTAEFGLRVYASVSVDAGATWSEQIIVANVEAPSQSVPSVAISPDNEIVVIWRDGSAGARLYLARGSVSTLSGEETTPALPQSLSITAYPNPFNPSSTLEFSLANAGFAKLTVFDLLGREVAVLADEQLTAGIHARTWNAAEFASGKYFARLTSGAQTRVIPLTLTK